MFLSNALNDDVRAIIAEGTRGEFADVDAAHRLYVRLVHARRWDATTAHAVYWAWHPVVSKRAEEDIPF
jgi:hypothetical protein